MPSRTGSQDLVLRTALEGAQPDGTPVWLMRQAGRYLPEFREVRVENEFFKVCEDATLAAEVTVQPKRRYPEIDGCILFSDILVVPRALGMECDMVPGKGPTFRWSLADGRDDFCATADGVAAVEAKIDLLFAAAGVARVLYDVAAAPAGRLPSLLASTEPEAALRSFVGKHLGYVHEAVRATVAQLRDDDSLLECPLIGFTGAPFTLLGYMTEGGGSKTWAATRALLYAAPELAKQLLGLLTDLCALYVDGQLDAGCRLAQVFETNGGELPPASYEEFALPGMLAQADYLRPRHEGKALMAFPKDVANLRPFDESLFDVVGVSWRRDLADACSQVPSKVVQGNMDPAMLFAGEAAVRAAVRDVLASARGRSKGHIFNLGHGMMPQMSPEAVTWVMDELEKSG